MTRRCRFLESFPAFYLNNGVGEGVGACVTNTVLLGSTVMETMLQEVNEICTQNQHSWALKPHQQVQHMYRIYIGESVDSLCMDATDTHIA